MPSFRTWEHTVPQGVDWEPLDRVSGRDGSRLVEADVTDIDISIFLVPEKTAVYTATGLDPGAGTDPDNRIFDSLQTDDRWKPDSTGYNSRHLLKDSDFAAQSFQPEGGRTYRVEIILNTTAWGAIPLVHVYTVIPLWSEV